jgi:hypothetical protein
LGSNAGDTGAEDGNLRIRAGDGDLHIIIAIHSRAHTIAMETQLSRPAAERLADEVIIVQNLKHQ